MAERLQKGALPLDEALRFSAQIADALDKAHRQGSVTECGIENDKGAS